MSFLDKKNKKKKKLQIVTFEKLMTSKVTIRLEEQESLHPLSDKTHFN